MHVRFNVKSQRIVRSGFDIDMLSFVVGVPFLSMKLSILLAFALLLQWSLPPKKRKKLLL